MPAPAHASHALATATIVLIPSPFVPVHAAPPFATIGRPPPRSPGDRHARRRPEHHRRLGRLPAPRLRALLRLALPVRTGDPDAERRRRLAGLRSDQRSAGAGAGRPRRLPARDPAGPGHRPRRRPLRPPRRADDLLRGRHRLGRRPVPACLGGSARSGRSMPWSSSTAPPAPSPTRPGRRCCPTSCRPSISSNAVAWNSSAWQTATIIGPALGGILYAFGGTVVFGAAAVAFALTACWSPPSPIAARLDPPREGELGQPDRRHPASSARGRRSWAPSRSTCSRSCSAAPPRCCRSTPATSCWSAPGAWACCAACRPWVRC